jgi:hypothetical protein
MDNKKTEKCAHLPCKCIPSDGEKYCSEFCRDAGSNEAENSVRLRSSCLYGLGFRPVLSPAAQDLPQDFPLEGPFSQRQDPCERRSQRRDGSSESRSGIGIHGRQTTMSNGRCFFSSWLTVFR